MVDFAAEQDPETDEQAQGFSADLDCDDQKDTASEAVVEEVSADASEDEETTEEETAEEETAEEETAEEESGKEESGKEETADAETGETGEAESAEAEEEDEEPVGDDHQDAIAALQDLGARLDLNKHERVWRIIFYEKHNDQALDQIHGLPSLKEVWILHTRVTEEGAEKFAERLEGVTVHYG